jgi:glycosyltransferase involved in cell wall biosynthesis
MTPLKITYLHYLYGSDTALHHVEQFANAARQLGHEVLVHALNLGVPPESVDGGSAHESTASRLKRRLKPTLSRYLHEPKELSWNLRYFGRESEILARERPDVVLVRDNHWNISYAFAARRFDIPVVVEVNSPAEEMRLYRHEHVHLPWVPERLERWRVRLADAVIAVSTPLKEKIVSGAGVPSDKVTVIANGVDVDRFSRDVGPDEQIAGHFPGLPVVGFVGSFQSFHNPEAIGRMAVHLVQRGLRAGFAFVGGGRGMEAVREITRPIAAHTLFLNRVPHARVPRIVRALEVGVLPDTAYYCCPLKILEWMAAGIAVVAPSYDSIRELIQDGETGVLFPPGDWDTLVDSVARLLGDAEYRGQLGTKAAAHVRESLTWRHNAERVVEVCRAAIAHRAAVGHR